ncbi:MAG: hypothetical protein K0R29_2486 [Pseudobdellovibrio sp.]|nr:hypothetical protein [Pseudobdellovibrio sp.]
MKTKLALFVTLFGLSLWTNAQQSPDRHKCFGLATVASQPVDGDIPVEYCIEAISVNTEDNEITVSTKITPEVFSDMKINSIHYH